MVFSLHQGRVVVSSQIKFTQSSNTHHLAHITVTLCLYFQYLCPLYSLPQPHHVTAPHPSPGDNLIEHGRAVLIPNSIHS